jgi:hypothetical protein
MAGKISLKTAISLFVSFGIVIILSACLEPVDFQAFINDPKIGGSDDGIIGKTQKPPPSVKIAMDSDNYKNLKAGDGSISGLTPGKYYMVEEYNEDGELTRNRFVKANGDHGKNLDEIGLLEENTPIINLLNSYTYKVRAAKQFDSKGKYEYFAFRDKETQNAEMSTNGEITITGTGSYCLDLAYVINAVKYYEVMMIPSTNNWGDASRTSARYNGGLNDNLVSIGLPPDYPDYSDQYDTDKKTGIFQYTINVYTGGTDGIFLKGRSIIAELPGKGESKDYVFAEYNDRYASINKRSVTNFTFLKVTVSEPPLPALTGSVSITGTAEVGQTLTANTDYLDGSGDISYQWKRGSTEIGTNSSTYVPQVADVGSTITLTVTRAGYSGSISSAPTASVIYSALTGTVSITGTAEVGQTLTANTDSLGGSGAISYQWKRGSTEIGTNSSTYVPQVDDVGSTITVTVTRAYNTGSVSSIPTAPVTILPLSGTVSIDGNAIVGETLTANTGSLGGSGDITYQWKRSSANVGSNSKTYVAQTADVGSTITVTVTRAYNSGNVDSDPIGPVIYPELPGTVSITGNAVVGQMLTANTGSLGGSGTISYQWKRWILGVSTDIGTNSSTYVPQLPDVGSTITVTVTRAYNSGSVKSVETAVVTNPSLSTTIVDLSGFTVEWTATPGAADADFTGSKGVYNNINKTLDLTLRVDVSGASSYKWYDDNDNLLGSTNSFDGKYSLYFGVSGYTEDAKWFQSETHTITLITDKGSYTHTFDYSPLP